MLSELLDLRASLHRTTADLSRELREKTAIAARLAMILDSLPLSVLVVDESGIVRQLSRPAQVITGLVVGERWQGFIAQLLPTPVPGEYWFGELSVRVLESVTPAGESIFTVTDITELATRREAGERDRYLMGLGQFAAHLSHQLRTPLSAAILYCGMLTQRVVDDAKRLMYAEIALGRLNHLQELITHAREHLGSEPISEPEPFAVADLVGELAPALRGLAQRAGARLRIDVPVRVGSVTGWRVPLEGAITNLVDNAIRHSPKGGRITLRVRGSGDGVVFVVEDEGPGVPEEFRKKVFEPFFTRRPGGSGLGLSIVRGVAERHGGVVEVSSAGAGARFELSIPRNPPAQRLRPAQPDVFATGLEAG